MIVSVQVPKQVEVTDAELLQAALEIICVRGIPPGVSGQFSSIKVSRDADMEATRKYVAERAARNKLKAEGSREEA